MKQLTFLKVIKFALALMLYCIFQILLMFGLNNTVYGQLNPGIYTVGTSGTENFSSLTGAGGVFQTINSIGLNGNITVAVTTNLLTEPGTYQLNQWAGGFTVDIVPADATLKTIAYSGACGSSLIRVNGADNFSIDGSFGGSGRYLRFESVCPDEPVIEYDLDCVNNSVVNCEIASDNASSNTTSGGAILIRDTQTAIGSDNFTLVNCLIEDLSGISDLFFGLQINAPFNASGQLNGAVVQYCDFKNVDGKSILLGLNNGSVEAITIARNHFYADLSISGPGVSWYWVAIEIETGGGHQITGNYIGGQNRFCAGSKLPINLSGGSQLVAGIRMTSDISNSTAISTIDSNVVRNININGLATNYTSIYFLMIESGNCNVGSTYGNTVGDGSVDATTASAASIVFTENFNSTSNALRGIYVSSTGNVTVTNNSVGGILIPQNNSSGVYCYLIYTVGNTTDVVDNNLGGVANNIVKENNNSYIGIYINNGTGNLDVTGNQISGLTSGVNLSSDFYGIRVLGGSATSAQINNNTISNLNISGSRISYVIRCDVQNSTISNNSISLVTSASTYAGIVTYGIYAGVSAGSNCVISGNSLDAFALTQTASISQGLIGVFTTNNLTYNIARNFIRDFSVASSNNGSYIRGISISSGTNTVSNNVVLLKNSTLTNDLDVFGIYDAASSGTSNIYFNTVDIRGSVTSGTRRSACYFRTNSCTRNLLNNIFNNRRSGGAGNYAMFHNTTGGVMTSNFNLLFTLEDANKLVRFSVDRSMATWTALAGGYDANSINPIPQDLVNEFTGVPLTAHGTDWGTNIGIFTDHSSIVRPIGTGFDMGAFEIDEIFLGSGLPVELVDFSVSCSGTEILLSWTTKSENQNDFFRLEASPDGKTWSTIAEVDGAGNSSSTRRYSYIYAQRQTNEAYYRIVQVDFDGASKIYPAVLADCISTPCADFQVSQSEDVLTIYTDEDCPWTDFGVRVVDINGKLVFSEDGYNGGESISISILGASGMYCVQLINATTIYSRKVVMP